MSWQGLSARDKRALVAGTFIITAVVVASRGAPWWRETRDAMTGEARNANTRVTAARALIASRATLQDSGVARSRRYLALATRILPGRSSTAAGAELTALVSGAAQGAGLRLASVQVQPDTVRLGVFVRVAVRADFSGDVKGLSNLLLSLERGPLMLRVRELSIAQAEPAGDDSRPEVLRSHVVVEALALSSRP